MPKDSKTAAEPVTEVLEQLDGSNGNTSPAAEAAGNGSDAGRSETQSGSQKEDARILRLERRLDELINIMVESQSGADDDDAPAPQQTRTSLRDRIPREGYEGAADFHAGLLDEIDELRSQLSQVSQQRAGRDPSETFEMFAEMNQDLEKYDGTMTKLAKTFGLSRDHLNSFSRLKALKQIARAVQEHPALQAELQQARRSGAVPRMAPAAPSLAERLQTLRQPAPNGRQMTIGDRMAQALRDPAVQAKLNRGDFEE